MTDQWRAGRLIGTTMSNMLGESVGRVEDVVIDSDGKVVAVMVGVGGFLGLGETPVAIGFEHLIVSQADADHLEVKTSLSRKAIEQAASLDPDYDRTVAP
jgi:sporulation protein YlmC with PRC-barrel domain